MVHFFSDSTEPTVSQSPSKTGLESKEPFSWYNIICTWFLVGEMKFMPGTLGSLAVFPIYILILNITNNIEQARIALWVITVLLFGIGLVAIKKFQEITKVMDHQSIVIDEVVGMLVVLSISFEWLIKSASFLKGILNINVIYAPFIAAFLLFRLFDIWKPLFIGLVDRYLKTPFGVILDDILAALLASFTIWVIYKTYII